MEVQIIFDIEESISVKNRAIKRILDALDLSSLDRRQKLVLRATILNEINDLYRQIVGGKSNGSNHNSN